MTRTDTAVKDGRRRRAQASRQRIVAAMLELIAEGHVMPGAEDVAARAAVGLRTVFRHFNDMESLYAALTASLVEQYEMWLIPFEAPDWRGQLDELIERRTATYERMLPFKRAGDAHRHISPAIRTEHARIRDLMRRRLADLLPDAIVADPARFEMIDLLLSIETWQRLRDEQGLAVDAARALVRQGIARSL